jgi:hypothetical protein
MCVCVCVSFPAIVTQILIPTQLNDPMHVLESGECMYSTTLGLVPMRVGGNLTFDYLR